MENISAHQKFFPCDKTEQTGPEIGFMLHRPKRHPSMIQGSGTCYTLQVSTPTCVAAVPHADTHGMEGKQTSNIVEPACAQAQSPHPLLSSNNFCKWCITVSWVDVTKLLTGSLPRWRIPCHFSLLSHTITIRQRSNDCWAFISAGASVRWQKNAMEATTHHEKIRKVKVPI